MKTTLDLPSDLVKKIKLRAVRDGRKLKDMVAEILKKGLAALAAEQKQPFTSVEISTHKLTGLPVVKCKGGPLRGSDLTPDRLAEILLNQETEWFHAAGG